MKLWIVAKTTACPMHRFTRNETRKFTCAFRKPHFARDNHRQNPYPECNPYHRENLSAAHSFEISRVPAINEAQNFKCHRLRDCLPCISRFSFVQSTIRTRFPSEMTIAKRITSLTRGYVNKFCPIFEISSLTIRFLLHFV